jgi:glycosyltransferase involved in cell wall biosynthesis
MTVAVGVDVSAIPSDPRGAGRYVIELVRALGRRAVVDLRLQARRDDGDRWAALAPTADVRAVVPPSRPRRLLWEQLGGPRFVDAWGIDVHHGPHYTMPEGARTPKVVTIHDLTFFDHPEWHERSKVVVFRRAIRKAAAGADALVCVSAATARRLDEILDPQCPVHAIPHGIDHTRFGPDPTDGDADALAGLGIRSPYLAFLGTLEPRKGLATLVAAFDRLADGDPELALVVAGGAGWGDDAFEGSFAGSRFGDRIVRTGYLPDATVPPLLRSAAAVVYPAIEEGFGLPVLEALACGVPVVTTTGSVMDEVAEGAAFVAPAGDPAALAAAVDTALAGGDDVARRRALGLEIAGRHTWDATAAGHERVYAEVAEGRR